MSKLDNRSYSVASGGKIPPGQSPKKPATTAGSLSSTTSQPYQPPSKRAGNTSTGVHPPSGTGGRRHHNNDHHGHGHHNNHSSSSMGGRKPAGSGYPPLPRPVDREPWHNSRGKPGMGASYTAAPRKSKPQDPRVGENLHRFICASTPNFGESTLVDEKGELVTDNNNGNGAPIGIGSTIPLSLIWSWYDQPYGHEVPLVLHPHKPEIESYFVPYLSAIQLFAPPQPPAIPSPITVTPVASARSLSGSQPTSPNTSTPIVSSSSSSPTSIPVPSVTTSSPTVNTGSSPSLGPLNNATSTAPSHAQSLSPPLFEYYERAGPNQRIPLMEKIRELSLRCRLLMTATNRDIDVQRSWFSISWYPILHDLHTSRLLSGCFLTYHGFDMVGDCPLRPSVLAQAASASGVAVDARTASLSSPQVIPIFPIPRSAGSASPRGAHGSGNGTDGADLNSLPHLSQSPAASPPGSRSHSPDPSETSDDDDDIDTAPSTPVPSSLMHHALGSSAADDISDTASAISVATTATGSSASSATSGGSGAATSSLIGSGALLETKYNTRPCGCGTSLTHSSTRLTAAAVAAGAATSKLDLPLSSWPTGLQPLASLLFGDIAGSLAADIVSNPSPTSLTSSGSGSSPLLAAMTSASSSSRALAELTWPSPAAASGNGNLCYLSFLGYVCHRVREDIWFSQRRHPAQKAITSDHDRITSADLCSGVHYILHASRPNVHPDFTHMTTPVTIPPTTSSR